MDIVKGAPQDAREIARIYTLAFPESVRLFFGQKCTDKLLDLLELTFLLVFHWGAEARLVKDESGIVWGYCLYLTKDSSSKRKWRRMLPLLGQMVGKVTFSEICRLMRNQWTILSTKEKTKAPTPKTQAEIVSIAVNPECQGQGVGTLLFSSVLDNLKHQSIGLNVRRDNPAARRLYAKVGFQDYGSFRDLSGEWLMLAREAKNH